MDTHTKELIRSLREQLTNIKKHQISSDSSDKVWNLLILQSNAYYLGSEYQQNMILNLQKKLANAHGLTDEDDIDDFVDTLVDDGESELCHELWEIQADATDLIRTTIEQECRGKRHKETYKQEELCSFRQQVSEAESMLEREKGKRIIILVSSSILVAYIAILAIASQFVPINLSVIFAALLPAILGGGAFPFLYLGFYALITSEFTQIKTLQDRMTSLEKEIHRYETCNRNC